MVRLDGQEEIGSVVVAILFSFLLASLLCLPVYICVKRRVGLKMSKKEVLCHQAADETLMLTLKTL